MVLKAEKFVLKRSFYVVILSVSEESQTKLVALV